MLRLGTDDVKNALFPFSPLEEQKEIVSRIENLFTMCDELDRQINGSKVNAEILM